MDDIGKYSCHCAPGYEGFNCGQDIDECANEPCLHNGTCTDLTANYRCDCEGTGYEGKDCEKTADYLTRAASSQIDIIFVIVVSLICVLIIVLLVLSLLFVRSVKRARATRGTYSPSTQEMFGNSASEILKPPPEERLI